MKIPYGISDFHRIRSEGYFYADKTPFIPLLESAESGYSYLLFLRPRRFGKSTLVSLLEHYYDIGKKEQFDDLFKGLWIHEHPTAERNRYLMLTFDFSQVATGRGPEALLRTFFEAVRSSVEGLLIAYRQLVPDLARLDDRLHTYQDAEALMTALMQLVRRTGHKLYVLIDEYDNFANQLLAGDSPHLYNEFIVQRTGFVRSFYAALKAGTGLGAVGRIFMTGVTPLLLNDLSSGFNIVSHVSQDPDLNTLAGLTRADVERAVDTFLAARPELAKLPEIGDRQRLLDVLEQHYDGYRFSEDASDRVFNSDMVLYFLSELATRRRYPTDMLDLNVRTEYHHLQRIGMAGGTPAAERRELFEIILSEGHVASEFVRQFGVETLSSRASFLSLLYYLGMLTLQEVPRDIMGYHFEIPNRVIRELQWEHLAIMLKKEERIALDTSVLGAALATMAVQGDIAPFLELFHSQVIQAFGIKDTRRLDEKTIKLLFMMYVSLGRAFHPLSEKEFAQGYCDLFLGVSTNVANARFSWLLEFKYLQTNARPAQIEAAFAEAEKQVERYASDKDLLPLLLGNRALKAGMIVFVGIKKALFRPWPAEPGAEPAKSAAKRAKRPAKKSSLPEKKANARRDRAKRAAKR